MFHFNYAAEKLYMIKYPREGHCIFVYLNGLAGTFFFFFSWNSSKIPLFPRLFVVISSLENIKLARLLLDRRRSCKLIFLSSNLIRDLLLLLNIIMCKFYFQCHIYVHSTSFSYLAKVSENPPIVKNCRRFSRVRFFL